MKFFLQKPAMMKWFIPGTQMTLVLIGKDLVLEG